MPRQLLDGFRSGCRQLQERSNRRGRRRGEGRSRGPLLDRSPSPAGNARSDAEMFPAMRTGRVGGKSIERFATFCARPKHADGWRCLAERTVILWTPRSFIQPQKRPGYEPAAPAIHHDEHPHETKPNEIAAEGRLREISQKRQRKQTGN